MSHLPCTDRATLAPRRRPAGGGLIRPAAIHHLVEQQAAARPQTIAVVAGDERLSYAELNRRANRLAHLLRSRGVGPGQRIGIVLGRTATLIVAVLAVLKAGGAYVPLDPSYPAERLAGMLHDSGLTVLLTTAAHAASLPAHAADTIMLDDDPLLAAQPDADPEPQAGCDDPAYVIYTSGSTGVPKGVVVSHGNLLHVYHAWATSYNLATRRCHLQMASFSFDVFSGDLVRALCAGATLVLCPRELLLDAPALYALMRAEHVDSAEFVPAVIRSLRQYLQTSGQRLDFMRLLVVGSDVWYMHEYRALAALCGPATRLISSYGVSEATIDSTFFEGTAPELADERIVPIGRAFLAPRSMCWTMPASRWRLGFPASSTWAALG